MIRPRANITGCIGLVLIGASSLSCWAQSSIVLRSRAQVREQAPVLLRDVADLQGTDATALADVVVLDASRVGRAGVTITPQQVREALRARRDVNLGRITISGTPTSIDISSRRAESVPTATPTPAVPAVSRTLRDALPRSIARALSVDVADLRLDLSRVESSVLSTSLDARTLAVSPTAASDPVPLSVRVYEGDRVVLTTTIRVPVQVRARRCVASRDLARGQILTLDDLVEDEAWLAPGIVSMRAEQAVGQSVRTGLKAGQRIEARHLAPAVAVRKGDLVSVDCVRGGVLIRTTMRARQDGAVGDLIALEPMNALERRQTRTNDAQAVRGRVAGPGAVVVGEAEPAGGAPLAMTGARPEDPDGAMVTDDVLR